MKIIGITILILSAIVFYSCSSSCCKKDSHQNGRALKIKPYQKTVEEGNIIFGLEAERISKNEEEYLPSSEMFRVVILDLKGKEVWNSSKGMASLTVITSILPEKVGEKYNYEISWNGISDSGKLLSPGKYKVILTIPAKPKSYVDDLELNWSGK